MSVDPEDLSPAPSAEPTHDPYAALRVPAFRRYLCGNLFAQIGMQMQGVAVAWEVLQRTNSAGYLAIVALIQFLPVALFSLPAGHLADRYDRRWILKIALAVMSCGSLGLAVISHFQLNLALMYGCLLLNGIAKAMAQPSKSALLPQIVQRAQFANALTWNSGGFQLASILGPSLAGGLIAIFNYVPLVFEIEACASLAFLLLLSGVAVQPLVRAPLTMSWEALSAGFAFVWSNKIILGALTLDLFAVLFGGVKMVLPIYAKDILHVGASGFGLLETAPAIGAILMSAALAHLPPLEYVGRKLLWSVAGFGLATIAFGFSHSFGLSLALLCITGALDMVSVVIRHSLVQLLTPDEMRGRVSAVNGIFIGASNELGGFESAGVASLCQRDDDPTFGPMVSVVSGGLGTMVVVGLVAGLWPQLRRYHRLEQRP